MTAANLRIGLYALYVVLVFADKDINHWWIYILVFSGLNWLIVGMSHAASWWEDRRSLRLLRRLSPESRDEFIGNLWLVNRQQVREYLEEEAGTEKEGVVERFSFGTSDHRETTFFLVLLLALTLGIWGVVIFAPIASPTRWFLWGASSILVLLLAWLRTLMKHLHTVLEVSPFGITEIHPEGTRRYIRWGQPLELRNRPGQKRLELGHPGSADFIALDYDRVGFNRIVELTFAYGGFVPQGAT